MITETYLPWQPGSRPAIGRAVFDLKIASKFWGREIRVLRSPARHIENNLGTQNSLSQCKFFFVQLFFSQQNVSFLRIQSTVSSSLHLSKQNRHLLKKSSFNKRLNYRNFFHNMLTAYILYKNCEQGYNLTW